MVGKVGCVHPFSNLYIPQLCVQLRFQGLDEKFYDLILISIAEYEIEVGDRLRVGWNLCLLFIPVDLQLGEFQQSVVFHELCKIVEL